MQIDTFSNFIIRNDTDNLTEENLVTLWHSVGWYDECALLPDRLLGAIKKSNTVFTAWNGEMLIGICSALDDGLNAWISYMAVDSQYQNSGLGGYLVDKMIESYSGCRIYVQSIHAAKFYKKHAFHEIGASLKLNNLPTTNR